MSLSVIDRPKTLTLHGLAGEVLNENFAGTGRQLMDELWKTLTSRNLSNKGINHWVYEKDQILLTGVELLNPIPAVAGLETKFVKLTKYASWTHIGPYYKLKETYAAMKSELKAREISYQYPLIEI